MISFKSSASLPNTDEKSSFVTLSSASRSAVWKGLRRLSMICVTSRSPPAELAFSSGWERVYHVTAPFSDSTSHLHLPGLHAVALSDLLLELPHALLWHCAELKLVAIRGGYIDRHLRFFLNAHMNFSASWFVSIVYS